MGDGIWNVDGRQTTATGKRTTLNMSDRIWDGEFWSTFAEKCDENPLALCV